ncbi:MAG: alanine--tRNA ligase [Acidobacteria bacterium]|nr:alanine--tRNA ligase [Acidobacteriota bacterium]MSO61067.1 alanine--tRNA ligase [Acidobacteriota bacterium]
MHPREIRASFLKYFERHGHRVVPSSPLLPGDDPTLLFTNAGMNQFKDVFLGREKRDYTRAASSQKCMRVSGKHNDLDNVGPSLRHHTFFEMLGNFSFGNYFKHDAIELAWNLLTKEWQLDPSTLYVTVFKGAPGIPRDDDAYRRWLAFVPADHIGELGMADNFWAMGDTGPCGRCSEIYVDRGAQVPGTGNFVVDVESGSERFVEIWNNVFMEFERDDQGTLTPLPAPSIDTGMGLERIAAVMQGTLSNYDTPLFMPLLNAIGERSGHQYGKSMSPSDVSMRVVADHARASTFLIADGVVPSNEWRGYVLRKIMRRAMRHGRKLGMHEAFLYSLADVLVREMGGAYPELTASRDTLVQVIKSEEERFDAVLTSGLPRLEEVLERAANTTKVVPGDEAFTLYDTHGLPRDFIEDLASNQGLRFDAEGFDTAMEGQRVKARKGASFDSKKGDGFTFMSDEEREELRAVGDTFDGYGETTLKGVPVLALFNEQKTSVESLEAGENGYVALGKTPFYLEAGGQVSDQGWMEPASGQRSRVTGVSRLGPGLPRLHRVEGIEGRLALRDLVTTHVDVALRDAIRRNHTGTHLLHAALRTVLGPHVKQAGSLVSPDRLRFDFQHFSAVTTEQLLEVERIVNSTILKNDPVNTAVRNTQEAIASGAMALFGEKYGDKVRVVAVGDGSFSTELCGGTHVRATGDIGPLLITAESGVAAGVRRVEALTGLGALEFARGAIRDLNVAREYAPPGPLEHWLDAQGKLVTRLQKENQQLKTKLALGGTGGGKDDDQVEIAGATVIAREVKDVDKESLRAMADTLKSRLKSGIVILAAGMPDGKVSLIASVTPDLAKKAPAGQLVKQLAPIVGGGGGGRADFAEAGGKEAAKIPDLLKEARLLIEKLLT